MPYLVGASAAQDTINLVRAALKLPGAHTSTTWVDWGHSEGGQTAMFVDHLGTGLRQGPAPAGRRRRRAPVAARAHRRVLEDEPLRLLHPHGRVRLPRLLRQRPRRSTRCSPRSARSSLADVTTEVKNPSECTSILATAVAAYVNAGKIGELQVADPYTVPAWKKLLNENDPGQFTTASSVPLLIIQGGADEQIPVVTTSHPLHPPVRARAGRPALDLPRPVARRRHRPVVQRHGAVDLGPLRGRREPRPVRADGCTGHRAGRADLQLSSVAVAARRRGQDL